MDKYYGCKQLCDNKFARKTTEVEIECEISKDGLSLVLKGKGDCLHHLVEDSAIFMNKIAGKLIGDSHDNS